MDVERVKVIRIRKCQQKLINGPENYPREVFFYIKNDISRETQNGKIISKNIKDINSCINPGPLEMINSGIKPNLLIYSECLDIYENNQEYYRDNFDELIKLEKWFSSIPEPYSPGSEWSSRENNRKILQISDYCNPIIRKRFLSKRKCLL